MLRRRNGASLVVRLVTQNTAVQQQSRDRCNPRPRDDACTRLQAINPSSTNPDLAVHIRPIFQAYSNQCERTVMFKHVRETHVNLRRSRPVGKTSALELHAFAFSTLQPTVRPFYISGDHSTLAPMSQYFSGLMPSLTNPPARIRLVCIPRDGRLS